ncbi:MAG: hypothetical protein SFV54_05275 [Bryobacteraceae bacterium]|nr:hypothetical protein [Bryobacteraceae bacterium]
MRKPLPLLVAAVLLCSCGREVKPIQLPPKADQWILVSQAPQAPDQAPETARQLGLLEAVHADYNGPAPASVTVYRMRSETVAFELLQKWRRQPATLPFQHRDLLVVPRSDDSEALQRFAKALAATMKQ